MLKSEEINELAAAISQAQGEIENASKNSANPHFKSKYADLAEVINCIRPVFSKHGLSVTQFPSYEGGVVSVETVIAHKSGQWMSGTISAPVSKQDAQGVGSATTYCRRYALAAAACLAQEDDDEENAIGRAKQSAPAKKITDSQAADLTAIMEQVGSDAGKFCAYFKINRIAELPASEYGRAVAMLEKKGRAA